MKCLWKLFYYLPKINVLARYGVKKRNAEQHMVMDFVKKMEIAVVNMYCEHDRLQTLSTFKSSLKPICSELHTLHYDF